MVKLHKDFSRFVNELIRSIEGVEGYITEREMKFLSLLAAYPTAEGEILEIGSFKGKSTIIIAKSASLAGRTNIVSVDPLTSPSVTDPDLKGEESCLEEFKNNIRSAGIEKDIEFHQKYSHELAKEWERKIGFLWVDGDHTYKGVKTDFDLFSPHLTNGGIIAIHDVLHRSEGCLRVFMEDVLLSNNFGPAGLCGSIGWSQFFEDENVGLKYKSEKLKLYKKLSRIIPYVSLNEYLKDLKGLDKLKYQIIRSLIPHSDITAAEWRKRVNVTE